MSEIHDLYSTEVSKILIETLLYSMAISERVMDDFEAAMEDDLNQRCLDF